jgi:hypothetical protein
VRAGKIRRGRNRAARRRIYLGGRIQRKSQEGCMSKELANDRKGIVVISALAGLIGGLCCLTPVVLVLLGLASVSVAAGLGNVLYGNYAWWFRGAAFIFVALALVVYFRKKGICTLDEARRQRNRILNTSLVVLIFTVGIYIFWTYVALQYSGIAVGLPWAQYDESWALPASAIVLGVALLLYFVLFRRRRSSAG